MPNGVAIIDTNSLPRPVGLDGPFWQLVLRLCGLADVAVAVPEIVVHESINLLRHDLQEAADLLLKAHADVSKFIEIESIYIPAVEEVVENWDTSLRTTFEVIAVHGEDAVEALEREALRRRPAREGKGSRDSAIWLTCLRQASAGRHVFLVSRNTKDFGAGGSLHPDLAEEVASAAVDLEYCKSLDELVEKIASPAEVVPLQTNPLPPTVFESLLRDTDDDDLLSLEFRQAEVLLEEMEVRRAYLVDGTGLASIRAIVHARDNGLLLMSAKVDAWFTYDPEAGEIESAEFTRIEVLESIQQ